MLCMENVIFSLENKTSAYRLAKKYIYNIIYK